MGVYKLSGKAEIDLAKTCEFGIEIFGLKQAQTYLLGMRTLFQILAVNVSLAGDATEFVLSLKRFSYKSHTIYYLVTDLDILIVRITSKYGL